MLRAPEWPGPTMTFSASTPGKYSLWASSYLSTLSVPCCSLADLLSPRGTNEDDLFFSCYPNDGERARVFSPDPLASIYFDSSDAAPGVLWAESKVRADSCYEALKETGGLVGTAFAVRDIIQTFDALGEDLVNFYGT